MARGEKNVYLYWETNLNLSSIFGITLIWILGVSLFLVGSIWMGKAYKYDQRYYNIQAYNGAVYNWVNTYYPQFSTASFSIQSTTDPQISLPLLRDDIDTDTAALKDNDPLLTPYKGLRYYVDLGSILPPNILWDVSPTHDLYFVSHNTSNKYQGSAFKINIVTSTTKTLSAFDIGCTIPDNGDQTQCTNFCNIIGGVWYTTSQICVSNQMILGACIKTSVQGNQWLPDSSYGGYGCTYNYNWDTEYYIPISNTSIPQNLTGRYLVIRSAEDPFVIAGYITQGTFYFGQTLQQKGAPGLAVFLFGILMLLFATIVSTYFSLAHKKFLLDPHSVSTPRSSSPPNSPVSFLTSPVSSPSSPLLAPTNENSQQSKPVIQQVPFAADLGHSTLEAWSGENVPQNVTSSRNIPISILPQTESIPQGSSAPLSSSQSNTTVITSLPPTQTQTQTQTPVLSQSQNQTQPQPQLQPQPQNPNPPIFNFKQLHSEHRLSFQRSVENVSEFTIHSDTDKREEHEEGETSESAKMLGDPSHEEGSD